MKTILLITLLALSTPLAKAEDKNTIFPGAETSDDVRAPSLAKIFARVIRNIEQGRILGDSSLENSVHVTGTVYRVYEVELRTSVYRDFVGQDKPLIKDGELIKGGVAEFLPLTIAVRVDLKDPTNIDVSMLRIALGKAKYVNRPMGFEGSLKAVDFTPRESQILELGQSHGLAMFAVEFKQVFDINEDGSLRLVFRGDGRFGPSEPLGKSADEAHKDFNSGMEAEANAGVGFELNRKFSAEFTAGVDGGNRAVRKSESGHNQFNASTSSYWGGALQYRFKKGLVAKVQVTKQHHGIRTLENDVETSRAINAIGVDGSLKLEW